MKHSRRCAFAPLALCVLAALAPFSVQAKSTSDVLATQAWVRWLPGDLPAAGYLTLENKSDHALDLVGASSPAYGSVMLHRTVRNGSTSSMEMVDKVSVGAHQALAIAPGGYHFMLEKPRRTIHPGDTIELKLDFSDGSTLDVPMPVKAPTAAQPAASQ